MPARTILLALLLGVIPLSASAHGQQPPPNSSAAPKEKGPRQEKVEISLVDLEGRCKKMLALQISIHDATVALQKTIEGRADNKTRPEDRKLALKLSEKEKEIIAEATKAIDLLEKDGAAVAFPEVFRQLRDDLQIVERRLKSGDVGRITQALQKDIIDTLKEMTSALKK